MAKPRQWTRMTDSMLKQAKKLLLNKKNPMNHDQVAALLGVSRAALYYHLGSKRKLLAEAAGKRVRSNEQSLRMAA